MNKKVLIIIVVAVLLLFFGGLITIYSYKPSKSKNNEYITEIKEYDSSILIDNIKGKYNKALYVVLFKTGKTSDSIILVEKNKNYYLFRDVDTITCYKVDTSSFEIVSTITNCDNEVVK